MGNFVETKRTKDCDSCVPVFMETKEVSSAKYELVIKVSPSDGEYEVNVKIKGDEIVVDSNISRG